MESTEIYRLLTTILNPQDVYLNEKMSLHTSFRTGGPADFFVLPRDTEQVVSLKRLLSVNNIPHFIMGNGTNLVFSDEGYSGVVIQLFDNLASFTANGDTVEAQAGIRLSVLANTVCSMGLSGLEFAAGIPGTLGGAVAMNAGAYGGEMKDVVLSSACIDTYGNQFVLNAEEHRFGYRCSEIQKRNLMVIKSALRLRYGNMDEIRSTITELNQRRRDKQPLNMPSAGSVFKRPEGCYAGKLIQDSGLRGYTIGGAQVSLKHCGFIVNTGNATSKDIVELINHIQETVFSCFGVRLETEVKVL